MLKLQGERIYLGTLEKEDCKKLWIEFEYDFENKTEQLNIGHSIEKADEWWKCQKKSETRGWVLSPSHTIKNNDGIGGKWPEHGT